MSAYHSLLFCLVTSPYPIIDAKTQNSIDACNIREGACCR